MRLKKTYLLAIVFNFCFLLIARNLWLLFLNFKKLKCKLNFNLFRVFKFLTLSTELHFESIGSVVFYNIFRRYVHDQNYIYEIIQKQSFENHKLIKNSDLHIGYKIRNFYFFVYRKSLNLFFIKKNIIEKNGKF